MGLIYILYVSKSSSLFTNNEKKGILLSYNNVLLLYTPSGIWVYSKNNKICYKSILLEYIRWYSSFSHKLGLISMFQKVEVIYHTQIPDHYI